MRSLFLAILMTSVVGCLNGSTETDTTGDSTGASATGNSTASSSGSGEQSAGDEQGNGEADEVTIKVTSFEALREHIAAQNGKIVIVDYWSTSCGPCRKEFPNLVEIHNNYPTGQIVCMSASLDYAGLPDMPVEECSKKALEFLIEQKATLQNFIFEEEDLTIMDEKLKAASIPVVEVFDTDGQLKKRFDGSTGEEFTYQENVIPLVDQLIAERFKSGESAD